MRSLALLALLVLSVVLGGAEPARAQSCSGVNHVTWPAVDPVWEFCWQRLVDTQFLQNGAGLRIYDVRYKGVLVLKDGSIPVLNVQYGAGGCGGSNLCYRDWFYEEKAFTCSPQTPAGSGYCDGTTTPASTVCAHPGSDAGSFKGVAVEDKGTHLQLTSQAQAGWYRYIPTWEFYADGTLRPGMDITSVDHPCVAYTHHHHAYFRLDVDLDGAGGDSVTQTSPGAPQLIATEQSFTDTGTDRRQWRVESAGTNATIDVWRNPEDGVADTFARGDGWLLAYAPDELDDGPHSLSQCPIDVDDYLDGESVQNTDVVLWVHSVAEHLGEPGGNAQDCTMFGPTLKVNVPLCGDGVLEPGEACDDSNTSSGDCCSANCQLESPGSPCDDGDACTNADSCDGLGTCDPGPPLVCDNGAFCDGVETCSPALGCQPGTPVDCNDAVACTLDSCDEAGDACLNAPDDSACDDGLFCDGSETCAAGVGCQAGTPVVCDDGVGCSLDSCDEGSDTCTFVPDDAACDNGAFCDGAELCDAVLDCQAGAPVDCDDAVACTLDSCDEASDCCLQLPDDSACDNGAFCDGAELCDTVLDCQAGAPVDCDDAVACTLDSCDEDADQCQHLIDDGLCDNGLLCDGAETCDLLLDCQNGSGLGCDDGLACTADSCSEPLGCEHADVCGAGFACGTGGSCVPELQVVSFQQGAGGYAGAQDSFLDEANPDAVHGSDTSVDWDADDPPGSTQDRIGLFRFDAVIGPGAGQVPAGAVVTSATLTLEVFNASVASPGSIHDCAAEWSGASASWNNFGGEPGVQPYEIGAFVANAPLALGTSVIDVTTSVQAWLADPNAHNGWLVLPTSTNSLRVHSAEASSVSQRPRLSVEYAAVGCLDNADCDDGSTCTGVELCSDWECVAGTPLDCDDADECTADSCDELGGCAHDPLPNCPPPVPASSWPGLALLTLALLGLGALVALRGWPPFSRGRRRAD